MADHAIRFRQRTACWHEVVENEPAFVHLGQKIGTRKVVAKIGNDDQRSAEDYQQPGTLECAPQPAFVKVHHAQEKSAEVLLLGGEQLRRVTFGGDIVLSLCSGDGGLSCLRCIIVRVAASPFDEILT